MILLNSLSPNMLAHEASVRYERLSLDEARKIVNSNGGITAVMKSEALISVARHVFGHDSVHVPNFKHISIGVGQEGLILTVGKRLIDSRAVNQDEFDSLVRAGYIRIWKFKVW